MARLNITTGTAKGFGTKSASDRVNSTEEIRQILSLIRQTTYNMRPVWNAIQGTIIRSIEKRFEDGNQDSINHPWASLSKKTIKKEKEMGFEDTAEEILVMTGELSNSIQVTKSTVFDLRISATAPHAYIHEFGLPEGTDFTEGRAIPARPFMYVNPNITARVFDVLSDYLDQAIKGESPEVAENLRFERGFINKPGMNEQPNLFKTEINYGNTYND